MQPVQVRVAGLRMTWTNLTSKKADTKDSCVRVRAKGERSREAYGRTGDRQRDVYTVQEKRKRSPHLQIQKREMVKERDRGEDKRRRECPLDCERFRRITMISL